MAAGALPLILPAASKGKAAAVGVMQESGFFSLLAMLCQ
jgi:hypothetical protein